MRHGGAFALWQVRRWVCQVHLDPFDQCPECRDRLTLAAFGHFRQHIGGQLHVPGIVVFAGFHHRTTRGIRITTALEGQCRERRFAGVTVVGVGFHLDHVIGTEICHAERAGADGAKVGFGTFGGFRAQAVLELRGLNDR